MTSREAVNSVRAKIEKRPNTQGHWQLDWGIYKNEVILSDCIYFLNKMFGLIMSLKWG